MNTELRPRGCFKLNRQSLLNWRELLPLMQHVVVTHCEYRFDADIAYYVGLSDLFEPIDDAIAAPWYDFIVHRSDEGKVISIVAQKVEPPGGFLL